MSREKLLAQMNVRLDSETLAELDTLVDEMQADVNASMRGARVVITRVHAIRWVAERWARERRAERELEAAKPKPRLARA